MVSANNKNKKIRNFAAFSVKQIHKCKEEGLAHHQANVLFCHISKLLGKWDKNCKHTPVFQPFLSL